MCFVNKPLWAVLALCCLSLSPPAFATAASLLAEEDAGMSSATGMSGMSGMSGMGGMSGSTGISGSNGVSGSAAPAVSGAGTPDTATGDDDY